MSVTRDMHKLGVKPEPQHSVQKQLQKLQSFLTRLVETEILLCQAFKVFFRLSAGYRFSMGFLLTSHKFIRAED